MSTLCEFIPQIIFLNGLFGYLCLLIVFKWLSAPGSVASIADLYHVMIYMFLSPGNVTEVMYPGMAQVQVGWARAYPASSLTRTHAHAHDTFTPTTVCVCGGGGHCLLCLGGPASVLSGGGPSVRSVGSK